jgi:leader peptidase (prepilin peptidase) / N-methyltransferase
MWRGGKNFMIVTTIHDAIHLFVANKILLYGMFIVLGLCVGSFCNVVIYRLPKMLCDASWQGESCKAKDTIDAAKLSTLAARVLSAVAHVSQPMFNLFFPHSHCPTCKQQLSWWCNIPLVSYFMLRGKCVHCRHPISWRYPVVEALCGAAAPLIAWHFGLTLQMFLFLLLTWALVVLIFIDFEHQLLPDSITLPLLWLGLFVNTGKIFATPENAILGAFWGYCSLWLVAMLFRLIKKKEGMGYGDFKLFAVFGAWLGWQALPVILLISSLSGTIGGIILILCRRHSYGAPMPFGPYLAVAGWLVFLADKNLFLWYPHFMP